MMNYFTAEAGTPQLSIIGKDTRLIHNTYGYLSEDSIRVLIDDALNYYNDVNLVEKTDNIILKQPVREIDLTGHFISLAGDSLSFEITANTMPAVASSYIEGPYLYIEKGEYTGITEISVKASTPQRFYSEDSFRIMTLPDNSTVLDFENGIDPEFEFAGESKWFYDTVESFEGSASIRSGELISPDEENSVTASSVSINFETQETDTLAFAYKLSTHYNSDGLDVFVDYDYIPLHNDRWSGIKDWDFVQYEVKPDKHVLNFEYFKWGYGSAGEDAVWIDHIDIPGTITDIEIMDNIPSKISVYNYPDPFNGTTMINFDLSRTEDIDMKVYNSRGQLCLSRQFSNMKKGLNSIRIDLEGHNSGKYFYEIISSERRLKGSMLYLK